MSSSPSAPRPWWHRPAPLIALLLHAGLFLGLFQLRFAEGEWDRMTQTLPPNASTSAWFERLTAEHGFGGLLTWFFGTDREPRLYHRYASIALRGVDPAQPADAAGQGKLALYRDVPVEYQPGALLVLLPPGLFATSYSGYLTGFILWCGVLYGITLWLGLRVLAGGSSLTSSQINRALWASLAFLLCFGSMAAARFDLVVPLFCVACLAAFQRAERTGSTGWFATSGALSAAGVLVKIVPGVFLPAALLMLLARRSRSDWRALAAVAAGFGVTLISLNVLFYAWWGDGYVKSYTYHLARGIQIESLYAGVLMAGHGWGEPLAAVKNFGAWHLTTPWTASVNLIAGPAFLGLSAVVAWRFWRTRTKAFQSIWSVYLLCTLFILAFILTNKVLSPQYLLWVGPLFVAGYALRSDLIPGMGALILAAALSQAIVPHYYDALIQFNSGAIVLLNIRNVLLVGIFVWLLWQLPRLCASRNP